MAASSAEEKVGKESQLDFDVHGALELHVQLGVPMPMAETPVVVEDVTKRCAILCLTVMQDVIQHVGGSGNMDAFLSDIGSMLRQLAKSGKKAKGPDSAVDLAPKVVGDIDLQRFYSGAHTPMAFTRKLAAGLTEWSAEAGVPLDNDAVRRICWKYYLKEKERVVTNAEWLSPECNYRLFLIYNRLLLKEDTTELEVGQVNAFLMKMVQMLGFLWTNHLEYKAEGSSCINFPEFVTLVTEYFHNLNLTTALTCELIGDLMDLLVNGVLKKGYLTKKGHVRKNWKRRFFVLKTDSLHYYRDREQTDKKGVLAMNLNTKLIDSRDSDDPKHPNKFVVTCGKKGVAFEITADSQQEKHSWMQAVSKAIALYQLNSSLNGKDFEESMAGWRRSTYGVQTEVVSVPVTGRTTSVMKRHVKEQVAHVVTLNRSSISAVEEIGHSPVDEHKFGASAPTGLGIVSPQPQLGQYVSMHRPQSEANSDGLCDYEAMAMNTTSSDSESEDDDAYVNCTSGQKGSGGSQGARTRAKKGSTSSGNRRVETVHEEKREGSADDAYILLDPKKDNSNTVVKEVEEDKKENHRYVNFGTGDEGITIVEEVTDDKKENHRYVNFGSLEGSGGIPVSCANEDKDFNCASPEGTGTRDPYANPSKPFASQSNDGTAAESIRLDLSDRGNRRKASRSKAAIEAVKQTPAEQTQLRQRSVTTGSSDDDGAYIPPSEIASYPVPMPRKATSNVKPPPVSKGNDLYLQM